ncbi:MAG: hypothetical protein WC916_00345 [Candidatus Woesearchaeota archaeon]
MDWNYKPKRFFDSWKSKIIVGVAALTTISVIGYYTLFNKSSPEPLPKISTEQTTPNTTQQQKPFLPGIIPQTPDTTKNDSSKIIPIIPNNNYRKPDSPKINIPKTIIPTPDSSKTPPAPITPPAPTITTDTTYSFITSKGDTVSVVKNFKDITYNQYLKAAKQKGYTGIFELVTSLKAESKDYSGFIKDIAQYGSIKNDAREIFNEDNQWESEHTKPQYQKNKINDKAFEDQIKSVYDALQENVTVQETVNTSTTTAPSTKSKEDTTLAPEKKTDGGPKSIEEKIKQYDPHKKIIKLGYNNTPLLNKYLSHRNIEDKLIDTETISPYQSDFDTGMQEVASYYANALATGSTHSQALAYAAAEASLAAIQTKTDAKQAILYAHTQGNDVTLKRWDSKLADTNSVKTSIIDYVSARNSQQEGKHHKPLQKEIIAALREEYGMNMSRGTLQKYLKA